MDTHFNVGVTPGYEMSTNGAPRLLPSRHLWSNNMAEEDGVPGSRFHTLADGVDLQSMWSTAELRMLRFELAIRSKPDWLAKPSMLAWQRRGKQIFSKLVRAPILQCLDHVQRKRTGCCAMFDG